MRLLILLIWLGGVLLAQTSLWKITHAGKTLYIGGTVHLLRAGDYPLPEAFELAFAEADRLVFETDMGGLDSPEYVAAMKKRLMFPPGEHLRNLLRRDSYRALKKYAAARDVPMALFDAMRPPMVVLTIMTMELQRIGVDRPGVDLHFFRQAEQKSIPVSWFERVEEQVQILAAMGSDDPDKMVMQSLDETGEYGTIMTMMLKAWRTGDAGTLERFGKKYLMYESPEDYRRLVVDRNIRWMRTIKKMVESRETELILVGTLHLVGPEGLIARLKRLGYGVEQL